MFHPGLSSPFPLMGAAASTPNAIKARGVLRTIKSTMRGKKPRSKQLAAIKQQLSFDSDSDEEQTASERESNRSIVNFTQFMRQNASINTGNSHSESLLGAAGGSEDAAAPEPVDSAPEDYQDANQEAPSDSNTSREGYATADEHQSSEEGAAALTPTGGRSDSTSPNTDQPQVEPRYPLRRAPRKKSCCEQGNCSVHCDSTGQRKKRKNGQRDPPGTSDQSAKHTLYHSETWFIRPRTTFVTLPIPQDWPELNPRAQELIEREMTFTPVQDNDTSEAHGSAFRTNPSAQRQNRKRVGPAVRQSASDRNEQETAMEQSSSFLADEPDLADLLKSL